MTRTKETGNSKSRCTAKQYTNHQISAPKWNIINHRNGMPLMEYLSRNATSVNVWERYPPGAQNINTIAQLPLTSPNYIMNSFDTGYQQSFPHIQNPEDSVIRTPFSAKNWTRLANAQSWENHFKAVPYNNSAFYEHGLEYSPTKLLWPGSLTGSPALLKSNWWLGDQNQVAININPCHQGVLPSQKQLYPVNCEFEDEHASMVVFSTDVKGKRKVKNGSSPYLKPEKLPFSIKCPGHKRIENGIQGLITSIPPESIFAKKITQSTITSEEVCDGLTVPKTTAGFIKDIPNPNGRGRSASVISEISSTTSFESKGAQLLRDSIMLQTPSEDAPSDKTIELTSTPVSQRSQSDKTSVSDFWENQKGYQSPPARSENPCTLSW